MAAVRQGPSAPGHCDVLILTATAGEGHRQAALALEAAFARLGVRAAVLDVLNVAPRLFRVWFQGGYETLVRYGRRLWGRLYWAADRPGAAFAFQTWLDTVCLRSLDAIIRDAKPRWVICTHSVVQPRLDRLAATLGRVRWAVVITDVYPHRMWLRGSPDLLFVPHERTLEHLRVRRPDLIERVRVTGIPVHPDFAESPDREHSLTPDGARRRLQVLLLAGGIGGGPLANVLDVLISTTFPLATITAVCGRNEVNRQRCLRAASRVAARSVRVEGYLPHDQFRAVLRETDILVGKPGGLTAFETLACGVPMVLYRPLMIPGQEEDNAKLLLHYGAAVEAQSASELQDLVAKLIRSPDKLDSMRQAGRGLARPSAALDIAGSIVEATS